LLPRATKWRTAPGACASNLLRTFESPGGIGRFPDRDPEFHKRIVARFNAIAPLK
jgi:hypothetical protein